jgi:hypothetical protein
VPNFQGKDREYLRDRINELQINSKTKNREISEGLPSQNEPGE